MIQSAVGDDLDGDGFVNPDDCDDEHASINDDATEVCDGVDNDCDGDIDEGVCSGCDTSLNGYAFCTGAGYVLWSTARDNCLAMGMNLASITSSTENSTVAAKGETISGGPAWWIGLNDRANEGTQVWQSGEAVSFTSWRSGNPKGENHDCVTSDNGSWVNQQCGNQYSPYICESCGTVAWYDDLDGDGYGDPDTEQFSCSQPEGAVEVAGDCDDTEAGVHDGATEVCDGLDNDCDGEIDEQPAYWYYDDDLDGFGDPDDVVITTDCSSLPPAGYISDGTDCDDTVFAINPGADELCNGADDDCDTTIDEDACGGCTTEVYDGRTYQFCTSSLGWEAANATCQGWGYELASIQDSSEQDFIEDTINTINASDFWNGLNDVDLEGTFEWSDGAPVTYTNYASGQPNASGNKNCIYMDKSDGEWRTLACSNGRNFVCEADGYCSTTVYADTDADGWGDPASPLGSICTASGVTNALDCDDTDGLIAPDAFEVPGDLIDDDCTGTDELFGATDLVPGDLVITELNANPAISEGGWVEVYNPFGYALSLSGLQVVDGAGTVTVLSSQTLARFDRLVIGGSGAASADVVLPDGADFTEVSLVVDDGSSSTVIDLVSLDASFPNPTLGQKLVLHPPSTDASDNDAGSVWCTASSGTPGASNVSCGYGTGTLLDSTPPARIDFDYTWTPGAGASFGGTTWIDLAVTSPFDPSGASAPGSVSGTFTSGNAGDGDWWSAHNEDGTILVFEYPLTGVVYRGVQNASGCYSGVMRVEMDFVGTWSETSCP